MDSVMLVTISAWILLLICFLIFLYVLSKLDLGKWFSDNMKAMSKICIFVLTLLFFFTVLGAGLTLIDAPRMTKYLENFGKY